MALLAIKIKAETKRKYDVRFILVNCVIGNKVCQVDEQGYLDVVVSG